MHLYCSVLARCSVEVVAIRRKRRDLTSQVQHIVVVKGVAQMALTGCTVLPQLECKEDFFQDISFA